jgi:hypothetical protein
MGPVLMLHPSLPVAFVVEIDESTMLRYYYRQSRLGNRETDQVDLPHIYTILRNH